MVESDFEHMARKFTESLQSVGVSDDDFEVVQDAVAEQLRQVWNARGAADLAAVNDVAHTNDEAVENAIRTLDRPQRRMLMAVK